VCSYAPQLETESSSYQSCVEDAKDARKKLQTISANDAEFDNLLHDAVSNGN